MVKVSAAIVEFCPGMSTATTLSSVPEACGLARFRKEAKATTMPSTTMAMTRILPEGRFFLAVPYSSPMLMVGPDGAAGGWGAAGVDGGVDIDVSFTPRFYAKGGVARGRTGARVVKGCALRCGYTSVEPGLGWCAMTCRS